jgi:hypothetical protein
VNPGRYNITVVNGTTFELSPVWKVDNLPVDLTGYTADMQVRDVSNNLITELSTSNGKIVINGALGQTNLTLTATQTSVANLPVGNYNYGLNLTSPGGEVYQIIQGAFIVTSSVVQ